MKKISVQLFASFFVLGFLFLASGDCLAQVKTTKGSTKSTPTLLSVTKEFVFEKGGLTISPLSGDVDFKVFIKDTANGTWKEKETGKIIVKDVSDKVICYQDAAQVKVTVTSKCDGCASVFLHDCK